VMFLK